MKNLQQYYFYTNVIPYTNYYPFGMLMPNRYHHPSDDNSYGFNGKESDREIYGNKGSSYDFGMRMYDSRIARFLSRDPREAEFPMWSPYLYAANSPIIYIDEEGEGPRIKGNGDIVGWWITKYQGLTYVVKEMNEYIDKNLPGIKHITFEQLVEYNLKYNEEADRIFNGVKDPLDKNDPQYTHQNTKAGDLLNFNSDWFKTQAQLEKPPAQEPPIVTITEPPPPETIWEKIDDVFEEGAADGALTGTPWKQGKKQLQGTVSVVTAPFGGWIFGIMSAVNGIDDLGSDENGESLIIRNVDNPTAKKVIGYTKTGVSVATGLKSGAGVVVAESAAEKTMNAVGAINDVISVKDGIKDAVNNECSD